MGWLTSTTWTQVGPHSIYFLIRRMPESIDWCPFIRLGGYKRRKKTREGVERVTVDWKRRV